MDSKFHRMKKLNRRAFIKKGALVTGAAILSSKVYPGLLNGNFSFVPPDLLSISGDNILENTARLFAEAGGIDRFVKQGNTVGLLVNSPWKHPGFYTNPDIPLAVAHYCLEAGASEIVCFKPVPDGYWEKGNLYSKMDSLIPRIRYSDERIEKDIPDGKELKRAEIFRDFMEVDVFINIPVAKHHAGTGYSGTMKGLMGVSSSATNRHMHSPDGEYTYDKQEYLSQCIADLNLLRKPDLCIVDAIECGLNNGPRGPSETSKPNRILLGKDSLATDVYAAKLAGFYPEDILTFRYAKELGLGKSNIDEISVLNLD